MTINIVLLVAALASFLAATVVVLGGRQRASSSSGQPAKVVDSGPAPLHHEPRDVLESGRDLARDVERHLARAGVEGPPIPLGQVLGFVATGDDAMLADVRQRLLAGGVRVSGSAAEATEALEKIESLRPSVAIVDVRLPNLRAELAKHRWAESPTAVIVYVSSRDVDLLPDIIGIGARGLVLREAPETDLLRAVEFVTAGETYLDPLLTASFLDRETETWPPHSLTREQRDLLRTLFAGSLFEGGRSSGSSFPWAIHHYLARLFSSRFDIESRTSDKESRAASRGRETGE